MLVKFNNFETSQIDDNYIKAMIDCAIINPIHWNDANDELRNLCRSDRLVCITPTPILTKEILEFLGVSDEHKDKMENV